MDAEVIVIGGGLAGLCAAIEAANAGAEVTLLEKLSVCGGSSVLSGGLLAFAGTDMQKAAGISDNETLLYDDLRRAGQQQNDEALVRTYVVNQMSAYAWLIETRREIQLRGTGGGPLGAACTFAALAGFHGIDGEPRARNRAREHGVQRPRPDGCCASTTARAWWVSPRTSTEKRRTSAHGAAWCLRRAAFREMKRW